MLLFLLCEVGGRWCVLVCVCGGGVGVSCVRLFNMNALVSEQSCISKELFLFDSPACSHTVGKMWHVDCSHTAGKTWHVDCSYTAGKTWHVDCSHTVGKTWHVDCNRTAGRKWRIDCSHTAGKTWHVD